MIKYIRDFTYGATKYPSALFKPLVFKGYFDVKQNHKKQVEFFNLLLSKGFKRTRWQLVFPGQIAGIVKKINQRNGEANQYHIRFYSDGIIECELEMDNFSLKHWSGPRYHGKEGIEILHQIFEEVSHLLSEESRKHLPTFFNTKSYTGTCIREN
mgnify:CR=1 FL=1